MAKIEQTFKLEQFSDRKRVGCYLIVAVMIAHLTIGGFLFFTFGWGAAILWLGAIMSSFYFYNKRFSSDCIVQTYEDNFSIEVTTQSVEIETSVRQFSWDDLKTYEYRAYKGGEDVTLTLSNEEKIELRGYESSRFNDYLKARFPNKKGKYGW